MAEKKVIAEQVLPPEAHPMLPEHLQRKWKKAYVEAYEAVRQEPNLDEAGRQQAALKEANRLLRVPVPKSHEEALTLEDWQVHRKVEKNGKLIIVTIDGKKHSFDVPKGKPAEQQKTEEQKKG